MSKSIWLVILAGFVALLIGCHAGGGNAPKINTFENQIAEKDSTVSNGRFADISFPSGAVIKCTADKAFQDGVKIIAEEDKVFVEYDYATRAPVYYYLYKVSALSPSSNALEGDVAVSTVEQPISITLPNNISDSGTCFVGFRADKNDPWRYSLIEDSVNANILPLRLAKRAGRNCTFNLFRLGYEFRLFVFDSFKEDEAVITSASATTENKITVKDSKYAEDLNLKVKVTGEKLDLLNTNSVICRITYRSNYLNPVELKADGSIVKQTDSSDKGVSGGFIHSFELSSLKVESQMSGEAILSLVLNLNDIKLEDFPTAFLIEFYSKNDIEKTLPFIYAQAFNFETEEKQEEPEPEPLVTYTISYDLDGGEPTSDNPTSYTVEDEITLSNPKKDGYTFTGWTGTDLDGLTTKVTIDKGSTGDRSYKANWTKVAFTITYDLKGGTLAEENPDGYNTASETFKLNEPTKTGYEFIGWTGSNGDIPQKPVSIVQGSKSDLNFTANWSINSYNITINKGAGINTVTGNGQHEYNSSVTATCTMLAGYDFDSWTGDFTTATFNMPAKDVELTANAKPISYAITYNSVENCTFTTANPTSYDITSASITLCNPTKTDYTFKGWSGTELTGDDNKAVTIPQGSMGERTYTANFVDEYKITYNLSGGTTTNPATYSVLSGAIALTSPSRTGYEFIGWSGTDLTGNENTAVTIPQNATGNREYTANWKLNLTLTITSANGNIHESSDNDNNLYKFSPNFIITPTVENGVVISDTEKAAILGILKITDANGTTVNSNSINKSWNNGVIALSFSNDLDGYTTYTISFGDIDSVNLTYSPLSFTTFYFKGSGTSSDPYQIASATQLVLVDKFANKNFIQVNDIDLAGYTCWNALCGEYSNGNPTNPFTGVFDGDSKKIKNFTIHSSESIEYAGLFGFIQSGAIKNLTVDGFSIRGATENDSLNVFYLGIIAAKIDNNSSITDCHITDSRVTNATYSTSIASLTYTDLYAGGICSINNGTIFNCSMEKSQFKCSADNVDVSIGGICSINNGTITNCSLNEVIINCSVVNLRNLEKIGGICADNSGTLSSCSLINSAIDGSKGDNGNLYVGGISALHSSNVEISSCDVQNSRVSGNGRSAFVGGIAVCGNGGESITSCQVKASSLVEGTGGSCNIGGIGCCNFNIDNCSVEASRVTANGNSSNIGGICGSGNNQTIINSHISGAQVLATGGSCNIGGIVGYSCNISNCYADGSTISSSGSRCNIGGIGGSGNRSIKNCRIKNYTIVKETGNNCNIGGIGGCGYTISEGSNVESSTISSIGDYCNIGGISGSSCGISSCYSNDSTISSNGDYCNIGGICGYNSTVSKCYVTGADISVTTTGVGVECIGGIIGQMKLDHSSNYSSRNNLTSCYLYNSNVTGSGKSNDYIGGICGFSDEFSSIKACYVFEETGYNIKKSSEGSGGTLGYLVGCLENGYYNEAKLEDSFYNNNLPDGGKLFGGDGDSTYRCYSGINSLSDFTTDNSNPRAWSSGAWNDYKTINATNWPPDLTENSRLQP